METMPRYAELHCKTNFSFLEGASHGEELVLRAGELGLAALAITDRNTLAGVVRAHVAAKAAHLKLLIGAEITPDDAPPVLLYAVDRSAYGRLSSLITRGRRAAAKGECRLTFDDIAQHAEGLLAAVVPVPTPRGSKTRPAAWEHTRQLRDYCDLFADRCYLAAALHHGPNDAMLLQRLTDMARESRLPLLATNDVHYHDSARRPLQDVLTAIRHGTTVAQLGARRFPNAERHLKTPAAMAQLFTAQPDAIARTIELADRCTFTLDELRYQYPEELCPPGLTPIQHLTRLTWDGVRVRYPDAVPPKVVTLIEHELQLIEELRYEAFFLTVWDLVVFARARGILCQGRGSAANSAVCYCLGITAVDPDRADLLFERFVSRERNEPPDIDVDFEHERREEVLQYIYEKYGRDRAGIAAEVICYRPRSAVRDVGKALGLSLDGVDRLAAEMDHVTDACGMTSRFEEAVAYGLAPAPDAPRTREPRNGEPLNRKRGELLHLASEILGFPRHLSQHVGGFVITQGPLAEMVPIENAAMPGRTVIEWDKDDLDALGLLKVDCLALGMLTCIRKCFELIERHYGVHLTLADVPAEDPAVYDMICRADTVGVFQIESRAQMSMLPRLRPKCFYDLVIEVAIVRPGPIQGDMVHPYLRRRSGEEPVTYPDPAIEEVLHKTLGVPLFQEQVMRLAMVAAGFTPGEADQLRRAMAAWKRPGEIEPFRARIREGMLARGLPVEYADRLFEQIRGFGEYGFPESHAASFALLAYISAWLKCHYPVAFAAALLNSQPMGFYAPAQIIGDLRAHGGEVRPVDIGVSEWDCTLEPVVGRIDNPSYEDDGRIGNPSYHEPAFTLRLGFRLIKGFAHAAGLALHAARAAAGFHSVQDVARRAGLGRPVLARLAAADAFGSLGLNRRTALWQVLRTGEDLPLFDGLDDEDDTCPDLPALELGEQVVADYDAFGLSLKAHPMSFLRTTLAAAGIRAASDLGQTADKTMVKVAGLVVMRQQPATAKGTVFVTLEDETGSVNLIVWKRTWARYRAVARAAVGLLVEGTFQRGPGGVTHVIAGRLEDVSHFLRSLTIKSRDFR
jgi:error-prone DNA polymerase